MSIEQSVYIIECKDGTLYTGYTNNFPERLRLHELGKGAKYTRGRGPFKLRYYQTFDTKEAAMKEEYRIKQLSRAKKEKLIEQQKVGEQNEDTNK